MPKDEQSSSLQTSSHILSPDLRGLSDEIFALIINLRQASDFEEQPDQLKVRIRKYLDEFRRTGSQMKLPDVDLDEAQWALTAFVDESILKSNWPKKDKYKGLPMMVELYNTSTAGETFFAKLDELRKRPADHGHLLEIYLLCLALGFEGVKFIRKERGAAEIQELQRDLWDKLKLARPELGNPVSLSDHPDADGHVKRQGGSHMDLRLLAIVLAGSALLFILALNLLLGHAHG